MLRFMLCALTLLTGTFATATVADSPAEALLDRSIAYHDPEGRWGDNAYELTFEESRPDGSSRQTTVLLAPLDERFEWRSLRGDDLLQGVLTGEECSLALNGSSEVSRAHREKHRLTCDRLLLYRNYYSYLWGLPMKLRDPGTRLDPETSAAVFNDRPVRAIRVTYDPDVGSDTWYFYFDPSTAALVGYRFFHDQTVNDGEYIVLEGEVSAGSLRLPKTRTWFTNAEDRLLGSDALIDLRTGESEQGRGRVSP